MTVAITPTLQDTWPPRVTLAVTGLTVSDQVVVYRVAGGHRTAVRGTLDLYGDPVQASTTSLVVTDAELPFGIPVSWVANVNSADAATTSSTSYTLAGGRVALTDAITALAAEVMVGNWPTRRRERQSSVFALTTPAGASVTQVVSGPVGQFSSQVELVTTTDTAAATLEALLEACTGGVVQLRVPDESLYPRTSCYVVVLAWEEGRWSQDGSDPKRKWVLDVVEVPGWAPGLEAQNWTLADLAAAYPGTLADLAADFATLLDLAVADIGAI